MDRASCPDTRNWQALLDELASGDEPPDLVAHLETCADCQRTLEILAADRIVWQSISAGLVQTSRKEPALRRVVDSLKNEEPLLAEDEDFPYLQPAERPGLLGALGQYEVQEVIGRGGMAVVFKALDPALHRLVAIKVMTSAAAGSPGARQRFAREAKAAAAVCHDHVVTVHGVHEADGRPYLVMQFIAGESLQARLDRTGPLEVEEIVRIGMQTALGLAAAHAQGLIHRDIKPANLLLENGVARVKITDFGLARMTDDVQLTRDGVVAGTPAYMAPEQARGETVDHRADLFSLGSVLYAMCTGVPPFRGSTPLAVLRQVCDEIPEPICEWNRQIPEWLDTLVTHLMVKDPADRFQSAGEVAALLEGYLAHLRQPATAPAPMLPPAAAKEPTTAERRPLLEFARRARSRSSLGMLLALAFLGLSMARWLTGAGSGTDEKKAYKEEYYLSLRGTPQGSEQFELFGPDVAERVRYEPAGLRFTLPRGFPDERPGTGLTIPVTAKGDFELTLGFEILQEPKPADAGRHQTLFSVDAVVNGPGGTLATIARKVDPRAGPQFLAWMTVWDEEAQKSRTRGKGVPTQTKSGRLRMVRTESILTYYASDSPSGEFRVLARFPFAKGDLQAVRLIGSTGGAQASLDVRATDLRIRSELVTETTSETVSPERSQTVPSSQGASRGWLAATGIIGLLIAGTSLAGIWLYLRQRRAAKAPTAPDAGDRRVRNATAGTSVSLRCSGCGKTLRGKPEFAGKKVRCPHCGTVGVARGTITQESPKQAEPDRGDARFTRWQIGAAVGLVLLLVSGGLVLALHQRKREPMVDVPVGSEFTPDVEETGFYAQHYDVMGQPFRWTESKARLVIPIDPAKLPRALRLHLWPWRPEQVKQVRLRIAVNGREIFNEQVSTDHWERTFDLNGIDLGEKVIVEFESDTFVPKEFPGGGPDDRSLGVQVRTVKLLSPTEPARLLDVPLGREYVFDVKESGFHQSQINKEGQAFRWTNGNARLVIPLDPQKRPRALRLHFWPDRPPQIKQVWLRIVVSGRELFNEQIPRGEHWKRTLDLKSIDLGEEVVIEIVSDTFVPSDLSGGTDRRTLGVEVREVTLISTQQ